MDRTKINYNLVAQSSKNIAKTVDEVKQAASTNGELSDLIISIVNVGRGHDDCLTSYSADLEGIVLEINTSMTKMSNLSDLCMVAFNAFLEAETHIVDGIRTIVIDGVEIQVSDFETVGFKEYVNSCLNTNDLIGSINPNNLEGQLSEEEWLRYEMMFNKAMSEATSKKEKAAIAAIFMTSVYPHMPYDWGGGHAFEYSDNYSIVRELGETYNGLPCGFQENVRQHTFDCSGYTSWILKEAGYPEELWVYMKNGERSGGTNVDGLVAHAKSKQAFGEDFDIDNCSVGDIAYMHDEEPIGDFCDDHIGVIVAKEGDIITVSHVSAGSSKKPLQSESAGIGYTKINTKTGEVIDDSTNKRDDRIGKVYFTHTASMGD